MNKDEFISNVKKLNIEVTTEILDLLDKYYYELIEYNKHTNLTAITNEEDVYLKHFYDSLTIVKIIDLKTIDNLLDIGSGAGFPGIVLKIFYPHLKVTLLDSNNKKTTFLSYITKKLNLENVTIIHDRVEKYALNNLNFFDLVVARAVTSLNILSELALPLVKENKFFIAMKGDINTEIIDGEYSIQVMKGTIDNILEFYLFKENNKRTLIKVKKVAKTFINELRPFEKISKKPLQKK